MKDGLGLYRLDQHRTPVPCSMETWGEWFTNVDRQTALTKIGHICVSTVFMAIDHNFGDGRPLLWETMVFGGELNDQQWRYSTEEEAKKNHDRIVQEIKDHQRGGRVYMFLLRVGKWFESVDWLKWFRRR